MTYTDIVERAKTGDTVAIAAILNEALRIHNVSSKVALKQNCLYVVLASSQTLEQAELIAKIRISILNLCIDSLKTVKIYASVWGEEGQAWHDEFRIDDLENHQQTDEAIVTPQSSLTSSTNQLDKENNHASTLPLEPSPASSPTLAVSDRPSSPHIQTAKNNNPKNSNVKHNSIHNHPHQNEEYPPLDTYLQTGTYFLKLNSPYGLLLETSRNHHDGEKINSDIFQPRSYPIPDSPPALLYLVGRIREVKQGLAELESGKSFEVYGSWGLGKSAIIQHLSYCLNLNSTCKDGIWSVHRYHQTAEDILQTFWDGFYESKLNYKPTPVEIAAALAEKDALVFIDGSDLHPQEIHKLQQQLSQCRFLLASSQQRLENCPTSIQLSGFSLKDARLFLTQGLQRQLTNDELEALETFANSSSELDDGERITSSPWLLKLAIWLAKECYYNLTELFTRLPKERPDRGLIALVLQQLTQSERSILEVLAAMNGAAMLAPHIEAISNINDIEKSLKKLVTVNLLEQQGDRYRVRADFATILTHLEAGTGQIQQRLEAIRHESLEYFQSWIKKYISLPSLIIAETDGIMTILAWGLGQKKWQTVLTVAKAFEPILVRNKLWGLWGIVLDYILQAARHQGDNHTWAWVLHQQGTRAFCLGDQTKAQDLLNQALEKRKTIQDTHGISITRVNLNLISSLTEKSSTDSPPVDTNIDREIDREINRETNRDRSINGYGIARVWLLRSLFLGVSGLIAYLAWSMLTQMDSQEAKKSPSPTPPDKPKNQPLPTPETPQVGLNRDKIDFGAIAINQEEEQQTLQVTNLGSTPLRIGQLEKISDNSEFEINFQRCSSTVAPNTTCQVVVTFNPTTSGTHTGKIEITDSDNNSLETVAITGIARKAPPPSGFSSPPPLTIMIDEPLPLPKPKEFPNQRRLAPQVKPSIPPVNNINPTSREVITPIPEPTATPEATQTPTLEETPEFSPVQPPQFIPPTPQSPQSSLPTPSLNPEDEGVPTED